MQLLNSIKRLLLKLVPSIGTVVSVPHKYLRGYELVQSLMTTNIITKLRAEHWLDANVTTWLESRSASVVMCQYHLDHAPSQLGDPIFGGPQWALSIEIKFYEPADAVMFELTFQ